MRYNRPSSVRRAVALAAAFACCVLWAAGLALGADTYWVVGGTGGNYYFVPVAGSESKFPTDHPADFDVRDLSGTKYDPQADAPVTLNPTSGVSGGTPPNQRLPGTGSVAFTPTSDQDHAGECKIWLTFTRDRLPGGAASEWVTVYKWVVVGCKITDVVRLAGLPNSVSPTKTYGVTATITPSLAGSGHDVQFDVINGSADNGTATITDNATRTATGAVTVTGGNQTEPGHAGQLRVRARLDGASQCGQSDGFSVCAHPNAVQNGPGHAAINTAQKVGMQIDITIKSDSGTDGHLNQVMDSEVVSAAHSKQGSFAGVTINESVSGWQTATTVPPDKHTIGPRATLINLFNTQGGAGSMKFDQLDKFYCKRCGMTHAGAVVIPNSGYQITQHMYGGGGTKIIVKTTKTKKAVTVGGFSSAAGPSGEHSKENTIRN